MAELIVDEKHRVTLPRDMRERLGIASGSKLEVEQRGDEIIIRPAVPTKNPTQAIWGSHQLRESRTRKGLRARR